MRKLLLFSFNRSEFGFETLLHQLESEKDKICYKFFATEHILIKLLVIPYKR